MVGRRTAKDTAALVEQVARGERRVEDIEDPGLRATVRLALRLYRDPTSAPDTRTRDRIRSRVLLGLHPRQATLADRFAITLEILARPTPYAMRAIAVVMIIACFGIGTTVASVASTPSDVLYSVKRASEQIRLALATKPEDRAGVELSIAEHRLAEAAALAGRGDDLDAVVLTSEYGQHLASAAAELAVTESTETSTVTLVTQLQQKIDVQRATAAAAAARLGDDPSTAPAAAALTAVANPAPAAPARDLSPAAAIAAQAASAADAIATAAERRAAPPSGASDARPTPATLTSTLNSTTPRPEAQRTSEPQRGDAPRTSARESGDRAPERAAEAARKAADEAKAAAQKAKEGSHRTPSPTPRKR